MKRTHHSISSRRFGFTLLEVMIAVVVLATGLLAIAALQGSLTRASAEAKVRGRVATMLTARMDELRRLGYANAALDPGTTTLTSTTDPCDGDATDWVDCPREQAALGSLSVTQKTHLWSSAKGAPNFTEDRTPTAGAGEPEFKRVELSATWKDVTGTDHTLAMTTQFSVLSLQDSLLPSPPGASTTTSGPIVREDNPQGNGVIPIALGNGDSSAASNPTPEIVGKNQGQEIVGTRFNVLTYTPDAGSGVNSAVIQKRIETDVIKCTCQYGAGGTKLEEIYQTAQWPAIWTGDHYEVYKPDSNTDAPGKQYVSGPKSGVTQSPYCTECCRDHHDTSATGVAKFDPEARDSNGVWTYQKYSVSGSSLIPAANTTDATYVDSCRMIRVDGLWRTAADMYSRQFGLLATGADNASSTDAAKTGLPTTVATNGYTRFVKDYLKQYDGSTSSAPTNAQALYDDATYALNDPALVTIPSPSASDMRYMHGRGLYVDYLEQAAKDAISKYLVAQRLQGLCLTGDADLADCILPLLPFTTVNLTEIAKWTDLASTGVLSINTNNLLADPSKPSGGSTTGVKPGNADNTATIGKSNSGVAVSSVIAGAVDKLGDEVTVSDKQGFCVGNNGNCNGGGSQTGLDTIKVQVNGGGTNPFVLFTSSNTSCSKNADGYYHCDADFHTSPAPVLFTIDHYNTSYATDDPGAATVTNVCRNGGKTTSMPYKVLYDVTGISSNLAQSISPTNGQSHNDGLINQAALQGEYTDFTVTNGVKDDVLTVTIGNAVYMCPDNYPQAGQTTGSTFCTGSGSSAKPTWSTTYVQCPSQSGKPSIILP